MTFLIVLVGWIFSLCLHEFAHAGFAYLGGDTSVRDKGYLTFNPLRYMDPMLSIVMPLVFLLLGGLGLPGGAVYINASQLRNKYWSSAVSLAGPAANLLFTFILVMVLRIEPVIQSNLGPGIAFLALLQVTAVVLSLLPLPPLDGYGALAPFLSPELRGKLDSWGYMSLWVLFLVLWYVPFVADPFWNTTYSFASGIGIPLPVAMQGLHEFRFWEAFG